MTAKPSVESPMMTIVGNQQGAKPCLELKLQSKEVAVMGF